tara:strand:- start:1169 stop:2431 length:1263 start_codon:yes stop_codon:yes gene_type:complete
LPKYLLLLSATLFFSLVDSKEILYKGVYFSSERDLANYLYFKEDHNTLIALTLDSIKNKRSCSFIEPFIEYSIRIAYELNNSGLLEYLYLSSNRCAKNNNVVKEIYLKHLIEVGQYEKSSQLLETLDKNSHYFFRLENRYLMDSGNWRYEDNFSTSLAKNSNINNGFTSNEIEIYGMTFEVSDDSYPVDDLGIKYSYSGTLYKYFKKNTQLRLKAYLSGEDYSGSLADRYSPFLSADYILTNKDMVSISTGRSYWNKNRVYRLKNFSYTRRFVNSSYLKMIRMSSGQSKSPLSKENSSKFFSIKAFFNLKNSMHINFDYIKNNTDFSFSTYSGHTISTYKEFNLLSTNIIPYIEIEKRKYSGFWAAYENERSYLRKNFGLVLTKNNLNNLKIKLSTNGYSSNIPIYDNRINVFEFEYSFF